MKFQMESGPKTLCTCMHSSCINKNAVERANSAKAPHDVMPDQRCMLEIASGQSHLGTRPLSLESWLDDCLPGWPLR